MGHPTGSESDDEEKISCWKKVKRRVPVFSAIFLMLFCSSLYFVFIATHFFIQTEIYWKVLVIVQGFIAVFMFVNFLCATFSDPGFFQKSNGPEDNQSDGPLTRNIEIRSFNVKVKWCSTCSFYRPPRCSHCSVCDYCVEKFDHHCPWVNNCIGLRNYRYFFGFVTGLTVHMLSLVTFITLYLVQTWHRKDFAFIVCWVILGVLVVAFPLVVSLTCFHIYLVITGRTTNEQVTGKFAAGHNPFDMGCWSNCCSVLCGPQYPSYAEFTYVNRSSLQEARIAWQKAPLEGKQHYGAEATSPANVEIQILPDHHNKHLSLLNSKHHHPIMMHSQLAKNGVSNVNRTPGSNHVMFGERNAAAAVAGGVAAGNKVVNLNTVDGTMGVAGTTGSNIPQQHNFSSISTTTNSTAFPSPSNRKTYSALHQQQQQPPAHSSINGGSGINAQYSVQNHQQQQHMANLSSGGNMPPGMVPGGAGTVSNMHQRHQPQQQKQPPSPNFRAQRGQNMIVNKATTPRMTGGQQRLVNSADILAPDLSDLEFEMSNAAGVGGVPKQISITAPGNAWSGDHASLEAHLMSPVNQAGVSSCTKSISLINAMQTCDMAIGNQKTSSYRPINNASSNNSSTKMLVAPNTGSQLPTRNPPKPPSRKSSTDQPKSVDLNNEEIFEISV